MAHLIERNEWHVHRRKRPCRWRDDGFVKDKGKNQDFPACKALMGCITGLMADKSMQSQQFGSGNLINRDRVCSTW